MTKKKLWFRAKKYGWGWYPITWQGWAVVGAYIAFVTSLSGFIGNSFDSRAGVTTFLFLVFFATVALVWICYEKGEPPRWRWGK